MTSVDACVEEVLKRGLEDWIQAAEVASVAKVTGGQRTDLGIQTLALEVVAELVRSRLMKPGDVTEDGFHEWDLEPDDALNRISREWKALGRLPELGEVCWLSNTSDGDRKAGESSGGTP